MKTALAVALTMGAWRVQPWVAHAQPSLLIGRTPENRVQLSWPESADDYRLEQAAALGIGANWEPASVSPDPVAGRLTVTIVPGNQSRFFRLRQGSTGQQMVKVSSSSPAHGEAGVSVNRETILRLSGPLGAGLSVANAQFHATFGGRRLLTRPEISADRRSLTLFYLENLPASADIAVTFDGAGLTDPTGQPVDPNGDGLAGGHFDLVFRTAGIAGLPGTGVEGHVFASEKNGDGSNRPLSRVTITVDGAEETLRTTTDASGFFRLQPAPAGRFFVHVDGRTANGSRWPVGGYYPFVGKAWEAIAGRTNNLAGGTGEIFLPWVEADTLQAVSATSETKITFSEAVVAENPSLAGVEVLVPPNALFSENGARGGKVGIVPVPPDRLPEPLPPGLNLPVVITIQTDGPQNFDRPVPVRFPNLPDPVTGVTLAPGRKTMLWSFNHDTGRWEAQGTATISADGQFAVTDPGVGVLQPGWHGVAPGVAVAGPPRPPLPSECTGDDCPDCVQTIFCDEQTKKGEHYAICALKCLGDVVDEIFGEGTKPERTAFETGLRCIGGPDKCPQNPEDSLTPQRRECMDKCRFPDSRRRVHVVPCEGFVNPCEELALHGLSGSGTALQASLGLLPDRFEEQLRFWEVEGEFLTQLMGTPKIIQNAVEDVPKVSAFFDHFSARVHPTSPAGIHLSPQERDELIALPRPVQFSAAEWAAMIDRLDSFQGQPLPAEVVAADAALTALVEELKSRGWNYRLDGLIHGHARLSRARAPQHGSSEFPARAHYFYLKHHQTGFVQRGRLNAAGEFEGLVLAPFGLYTVLYLDPVTGRSGGAFFQAGDSGSNTVIPSAPLEEVPVEEPDSDGDQLDDFSEFIVGTSPALADSDNDGLRDGEEIAGGTNPLDGAPQALGTIAGADTPGTAVDVVVWNDLAVVADSNAGVSLFGVANPLAPVWLSQYDTPGRALSVAATGGLVAVADEAEGVVLLDTSDPTAPLLRARVKFNRQVRAVTLLEGNVAAGLASGEIVLLNEVGGEISRTTTANTSAIEDLLVLNGYLYVLKAGSVETITFDGSALTRAGTVEAAGSSGAGGRRWRLAGGGNRLYATHTRGYHVFDLSTPLAPNLLRSVTTGQFGWKQLVPDGAGWGLAAVDANSTDDGVHDVSVYAVGSDGTGTNVVATLATPGLAAAACYHRGFALVADGAAGLSVVNDRGREVGSTAPTVSVSMRLRPGAQTLESGAPFTVVAEAADDHRVSHVEFHLDGVPIGIDGNPPFEFDLRAPVLAAGQTQLTLRARAFDTAGNSTWSEVLSIDPSQDQTGPRVLITHPGSSNRFAVGSTLPIGAQWDEPLDLNTVAGGFRLMNLGPDETAGTPDDVLVPTAVEADSESEFSLVPLAPLAIGSYQARVGPPIADRLGNTMASEVSWDFRVQPIGHFVGGTSLVWNSQPVTSNNWSFAHLPTLDDFVRLATPDGATVRVGGAALAYDLVASTPVAFDPNASLRIAREATFGADVTMDRSVSWRGGTVNLGGDTRVLSFMSVNDQNWVNEGRLLIESSGSIHFANAAGVRTTIRNAAGAVWEMVDSQIQATTTSGGVVDFINEGRFIARGSGRNYLGASRLFQLGTVEVQEGILDIQSGSANLGPSQHLGSYRVDAGATLIISALGEFGRASRIHGEGTVQLAVNIPFDGTYETSGSNLISGPVTFGGDVRTTGPWNTRGGHAIFTGLSPRLAGPVISEGAMTVSSLPNLEADEVQVYRDFTVNTELQVNGLLRLDSTVSPSGSIAAARLLGAGRIRALGPVIFAGIVNSAGQGVLEIRGSASADGVRTIVQFNNNHALAILPGGTFDVSGIERVTARGGLTNEGVILKADASATELTRSLLNRGQVRVEGGTLTVMNGRFVQTAGSLILAGGSLVVRPSAGVATDTTVSLEGGVLAGAGVLTCQSVTNVARIEPGGVSTGILDLQVGDHPIFSVFEQTAGGILALDLKGPSPGDGHDQVKTSGRAVLGGTLEVRVDPVYDPAVGQEWTVLTAKTRQGTFAQVTGADLPNRKRVDIVYSDTDVTLRVVEAP